MQVNNIEVDRQDLLTASVTAYHQLDDNEAAWVDQAQDQLMDNFRNFGSRSAWELVAVLGAFLAGKDRIMREPEVE